MEEVTCDESFEICQMMNMAGISNVAIFDIFICFVYSFICILQLKYVFFNLHWYSTNF